MENIINIITGNINMAIFVLGLVLGFFIIRNAFKLSKHQSEINITINGKDKKTTINRKNRSINESEVNRNANPETIREYEKEFNKTRSRYNMLIQLIPIFPLMGILGTVAGLMKQAGEKNIEALFTSLDTALYSTFFGLIFAIVLKFIATVFSGKIVDDVDIMLDDYFNKFNDTIAQNHISEE